MDITALVHINFDLLLVGVAIAGIALLGCIIYFNNQQSVTNRAFFVFALWNVIWSISNYFEYQFTTAGAILWALRFHLFLSTWYAFLFFRLAYVFPREKIVFPGWYRFGLIPIIATTSILTLTPVVFSGLDPLALPGQVTRGVPGPGIVIFILVAFGTLISGLVILFRRMRQVTGVEHRQTLMLFLGMFFTAILILTFNVILPNIFSNRGFIPLAALFLLPFITLTFYAIYKHHLFNLKVVTTVFLGFMVTVFSFVNILYSTNVSGIAINVTAFLIVLIGSIKIVQDTLNLERLTEELSVTNRGQENLIHIMNHQIKGYLGTARSVFAELLQSNDYGQMPEASKPLLSKGLEEMTAGVDYVQQILKGASAHSGTVSYDMKPIDLKSLVSDLVVKQKEVAEKAGLSFESNITSGDYSVTGDTMLLEEAFKNLITNAIKYNNPNGSIAVTLSRTGEKILFVVKDTGLGISKEDAPKLFKPGGVGKDSIKYNVEASGFGLALVKPVVEKHQGRVWYTSNSPEKGTTFFVELPVSQTSK